MILFIYYIVGIIGTSAKNIEYKRRNNSIKYISKQTKIINLKIYDEQNIFISN